MVSGGTPKRELVPPGRRWWVARVVHHDGRSLTTGGLLPGALSLGDTQDCIIGGFHHGGALALRAPRRGRRSFGIIQLFWIPT